MANKKIKLTTNHATSRYGVPVFVDNERNPLDYAEGFRRLRAERGWSTEDVAERCDVSRRTVEGWEQGRMPSVEALLRLMRAD